MREEREEKDKERRNKSWKAGKKDRKRIETWSFTPFSSRAVCPPGSGTVRRLFISLLGAYCSTGTLLTFVRKPTSRGSQALGPPSRQGPMAGLEPAKEGSLQILGRTR
ncbi:hypothetical protein PoB_001604200 [Plakobranchus ocellatus]|uniref:Uncharacterized protein n=1 Tax=Plakobranchus ocellatus TaxID=259542 RepID=A0AAV3Z2T5_9GAST|nr:hypothetical protein PoB_001604200 [Plakobranchus ocellatus]